MVANFPADGQMRVAQVLRSASRKNAGVFEATLRMSLELKAFADLKIEVFTLDDAWLGEDLSAWGPVRVNAFDSVGPESLGYSRQLLPRLRQFDPDVIHVHGLWSQCSRSAWQASRKCGARLVVTPHGMLLPWARNHKRLRKAVAWYLYQRKIIMDADCVHATSENEAEELRSIGVRKPIAVIPLGVESVSEPCKAPFSGRRTALYLGRLHPVKGLDRLVKAWALVGPMHPSWQLSIVGPDQENYRGFLELTSQKMKCSNLEFGGFASGIEKSKLLSASDLFVLPSLSENFALTILEALSYGVPVVASTASPWKEVVTIGCGWHVDPEIQILARTLDEAMSITDEHRRTMGKNGRAWVMREFSWSKSASKLYAVYLWLSERNGRPEFIIT